MTPQGRVGTRGCRELDGERKGGVGGRSRLLDLVGLKTWVYCRRLVAVVGGVTQLTPWPPDACPGQQLNAL